VKRVYQAIGIAIVLALVALKFSVHVYYVPSSGMQPALVENDRVWANFFAYRFADPKRGHIIVFYAPAKGSPGDKRSTFIKRVIGLPGETVEVKAYKGVYINGRKLDEPYIGPSQTPDYDWGPERIPANQYFVLGDNRRNSNDSHIWGLVSRDAIRGKVFFRFAPPNRVGKVR
jgi:signal peptidase I